MATTSAAPRLGSPVAAPALHMCPVCGNVAAAFASGPGGRPGARCDRCQALERHRFLALLLRGMGSAVAGRVVLDVAPSAPITSVLRSLQPRLHLRIDFDPAADGRSVDAQASVTALPFGNGTIDVLICYHVLEHVPDDRTAMRELARVLTADGVGLVQVPFRPGGTTDEDPSADAETRIRRFGQADHVRYYGADFEDRLRACGLRFTRIGPTDIIDDRVSALIGASPVEYVWIVARADSPVPPDLEGLRAEVSCALVLELARHYAESTRRVAHLNGQVTKYKRRLDAQKAARKAAPKAPAPSTRTWQRSLSAALPRPVADALRPRVRQARKMVRRVRGGAPR